MFRAHDNQINREIADELEKYTQSLIPEHRIRFNDGLSKALLISLNDRKVYTLVRQLFQKQNDLSSDLSDKRQHLLRNLQDDPLLEEKLLENDTKIVNQLDEMCRMQQEEMAKLQVPGFRTTVTPRDIELQILILDFVKNMKYYNK